MPSIPIPTMCQASRSSHIKTDAASCGRSSKGSQRPRQLTGDHRDMEGGLKQISGNQPDREFTK